MPHRLPRMIYPPIRAVVFGLMLMALPTSFATVWADDQAAAEAISGCEAFGAELASELGLLTHPDQARKAALNPAGVSAVALQAGAAHALLLAAPSEVTFVIAPGRQEVAPESYAGMVAFTAPVTGTWRVAISRRAWIDLIDTSDDGSATSIASTRHSGRGDCPTLHKFVEFPLQAGESYVVQLSGSPAADIHVVVTGPLPDAASLVVGASAARDR